MKVLFVSLYHVEYAVELANALSRSCSVHLVLSRRRVFETVGSNLNHLLSDRVDLTLLEKYGLRNLRIIDNFVLLVKLFYKFRPDVIHMQECADLSNLALFMTRVPTVATVHDVHPHPGSKINAVLRLIAKVVRKYFYKRIIVHGEAVKKQFIQDTHRLSSDVFVIPHGCLFSFDSLSGGPVEKEEDNSVLFFGRIQEYKGLRYLIDAAPLVKDNIPDFKVIVAGTGDDLDLNRRVFDGNPHFEIHDYFIPNGSVARLFRRSALVVAPYIEATQSGIIAMAFAFGKPVIATQVGSLAEMVQNGRTGIVVPPRNVQELANAIIYLLKQKGLRKQMGVQAKKAAKSIYGWERIAALTTAVYTNATPSN